MNRSLEVAGTACGILGPAAFLTLYIVAMAGDPGYTFFGNYLSDLGVGPAAWAFNSAVIVAGALGVAFALLGLRPALEPGISSLVGVATVVVGSVFLILVGVFTEDAGHLHVVVSLGFFGSMEIGLFFLSYSLYMTDAMGKPATAITEVAFAVGVLLFAFGFNPQTETVSVLLIIVWCIAIATIRLKQLSSSPTS